jgi:hypothetical protein
VVPILKYSLDILQERLGKIVKIPSQKERRWTVFENKLLMVISEPEAGSSLSSQGKTELFERPSVTSGAEKCEELYEAVDVGRRRQDASETPSTSPDWCRVVVPVSGPVQSKLKHHTVRAAE